MPQGPSVLLPPRPPQPTGTLPQTPLRQTNPVLANLQDFLLSALGITDGLGPDASNAAILGVGAGALLPILGTVRKAKTAEQAIEAASQRIQGIKAYHGSPHDFDQFSLSKIGTGEGAQAYGPGLYFAENPQVAKEYKGKPIAVFNSPAHEGKHAIMVGKETISTHTSSEAARKALAKASAGKTYEVELNAAADDFLDWDKPMSQQSEKVQKALGFKVGGRTADQINDATEALHREASQAGLKFTAEKEPFKSRLAALEKEYYDVVDNAAPSVTGEDFFRDDVLRQTAADEVARMEWLKSKGIKGIRYLDQGSRGEGKGTYNYVVNDEAIISVMKKYGVALPIAAAGIKAQREREGVKQSGGKMTANVR